MQVECNGKYFSTYRNQFEDQIRTLDILGCIRNCIACNYCFDHNPRNTNIAIKIQANTDSFLSPYHTKKIHFSSRIIFWPFYILLNFVRNQKLCVRICFNYSRSIKRSDTWGQTSQNGVKLGGRCVFSASTIVDWYRGQIREVKPPRRRFCLLLFTIRWPLFIIVI